MIPQIEPLFGDEEQLAVRDYMQSGGWLTEHTKTSELESVIADFLQVRYCIMVTSGTMALYATLMSLGIGHGDKVIVPAFTMIATAFAIQMTGAQAVLCDIDPTTLCIDVNAGIPMDASAIITVHLNGRSANMDELLLIGNSCGMYIVEDCAQAFGSMYHDEPLGSLGTAGCFSLSPHKIISTGQGGFITTNDDALATEVHKFKNFGRVEAGGYHHESFGTNLKYTDLQAVIGLAQMKKLPQRIDHKRSIFAEYWMQLAGVGDITMPSTDLKSVTPWYVDILTKDRYDLAVHLASNGIRTQQFYPSLHQTQPYDSDNSYPNAEYVSEYGMWLPSSLTLTDNDIATVCDCIKEFYGGER